MSVMKQKKQNICLSCLKKKKKQRNIYLVQNDTSWQKLNPANNKPALLFMTCRILSKEE